ncbi:MAG: hypothetical protein A3G49_06645 [Candidatus Sungbacteria bacterium RIFCSPLOWO2_12_FULL_41_11]|uniref:Uncharacterized protein n=1 Tax=Candidatus Sungbacteria bacterium RIFCSPLOWO2_12_FULL_41_11 TaxID=1802286 RepID=A0A1G2LS97_9BACT|nr:MAG: hypothetical protein UV01_C0003G0107 [Parcubacteria group bacterium GW2011_GWA2_42_14]OGZ98954.1 MAG: hypothetical protein A3D41_04945 [Candidatus Sungbacteria bacterium RIFCSPHIGHO2_02_FULL_41_12b]OHA14496.1 MAG: hypothetical protein A3G49_06645 [Candidatus Sungbacteria bacterium RIFCSPLOWO2_12_FULL_41_11]
MQSAKCVSLKYLQGSFDLVQGVKQYQGDGKSPDGSYFRNRGYGWGEIIVPSQLVLTVQNGKKKEKIDIALFFKQRWGKLVGSRRNALTTTMPGAVLLTGKPGKYTVSIRSLQTWLKKAQQACVNPHAKSTTTENRTHREEREERAFQKELRLLEERRANAMKLVFQKGFNPKYGNEQWEARSEGRKYILERTDNYSPSEGTIPIEIMFDLIPDRVTLVRRI